MNLRPALFATAVLVMLLWLQGRFPALLEGVQALVFDSLIAAHPASPEAPITVVSIDEASLERYGAWPWSDCRLSRLVDAVEALGASAVALAAIPSGQQASDAGDEGGCSPAYPLSLGPVPGAAAAPSGPLGASLSRLASSIGFALLQDPSGSEAPPRRAGMVSIGRVSPQLRLRLPGRLLPAADAMRGAAGIGALNVYPDKDGRLRRVPVLVQTGEALYPSLAAEVLRLALGETSYLVRAEQSQNGARIALKIGHSVTRLNDNGEIWLHYAPRAAFPILSAVALLSGDASAGALSGRVAMIGVSAPGIGEMVTSPLGERLSPAEIHAQALSQLISGAHPVRPEGARGAELAVAVGGSLLLILISLWRRGLWLVLPGALMVVLVLTSGYLLFAYELLLLDVVSPLMTITAVYLALTVSGYLVAERERRWIKHAFSSYVSPTLVRHLIRHPEQLRLSGERRECSFIMTDLAGFTPLVEGCAPEALVDLLNRYLDELIGIVFAHQGTIDRIVGDAISVRFSAPVRQPDHAQRALDCARAMDRAAAQFAEAMQGEGVPFGETRIGVHSGEVIVGNFGGSRHFDYRALGDPINTAARLESANRFFGTRITISGATLSRCAPARVRPIGHLLLKGKTEPIATFTPLTPAQIASGLAQQYAMAYRAMAQGDSTALEAFAVCAERFADDRLSAFHEKRLREGQRGVVIELEK
jgi:adenylate cyclase